MTNMHKYHNDEQYRKNKIKQVSRYLQTTKGKDSHRKAKQKYKKSMKGKISDKRWKNKRYIIAEKIITELKENDCSICGYTGCESSLHFHHVVSDNKIIEINTTVISRRALDLIIEELNKCVLVCCNCHGEIHEREKRNV